MAAANGHDAIVMRLLDAGAHINESNEAKNTPLRTDPHALLQSVDWAAFNGRTSTVKLLLERKANANVENEFARVPFDEASLNSHDTIMAALLNDDDRTC